MHVETRIVVINGRGITVNGHGMVKKPQYCEICHQSLLGVVAYNNRSRSPVKYYCESCIGGLKGAPRANRETRIEPEEEWTQRDSDWGGYSPPPEDEADYEKNLKDEGM